MKSPSTRRPKRDTTRVRPRNFEGEGEGGRREGKPEHFFFAADVEKSPLNLTLSSVSFQVSPTCDIARARIKCGENELRARLPRPPAAARSGSHFSSPTGREITKPTD